LHLYREGFQYFRMGYASALAWFLFLIGLLLTIAVLYSSRRWVYYSSGD
jgi:multiple sugar transport system permease protein